MKFTFPSRHIVLALALFASTASGEENTSSVGPPQVMTFGEMRLAIGQQQHQGRVVLRELIGRKHFYGVGALAGLNGEITIRDSEVLISSVDAGKPQPVDFDKGPSQATLLAGAYVSEWSEHNVPMDVTSDDLEEFIRQTAERAGLDTTRPFVFRIDGEFQNVRLHIINGACPVHARVHGLELPVDAKPYEAKFTRVRGMVIGIYAKDAVGKLTHPGTSTHMHLIFKDDARGIELTGHVEKIEISKDALLQLPQR